MLGNTQVRRALYGLFTLSGFAGLIYESIWSHYLKLFLGHAAYAQTLVLVIFMGGMALGAAAVGRYTERLREPLRLYALAEGLLGLGALAFDPFFRALQRWIFDSAIPQLGQAPLAIDVLKWSASALTILPQSILLGATFPLMSAGLVRLFPATSGRTLGWLYFTNSLGAAIGVLVSGFYLIAHAGLPGTITCAGFINFGLAAAVMLLLRFNTDQPDVAPAATAVAASASTPSTTNAVPLMLSAALLTGMASFCYEVGWLRMLAMVLGSASHSFELMLSAFILGIALGAFYIRRKIEDNPRPLRTLGWIQVAMATAAFATIPLYNASFDWMAFIIGALRNSDSGYVLFNLLSHGICMALMLPVTVFAGMTLPMITTIVLRRGGGEAAIGRVYAANTLGSIAGVLIAVHLITPLLGLRQVVVIGALIDLGLGLALLFKAQREITATQNDQRRLVAGCATAVAIAAGIIVTVPFDQAKMASGVYRYGMAKFFGGTLWQRDGKTASVSVFKLSDTGRIAIATNGKIDAAILPGDAPSTDDYTMISAAVLPMMMLPNAEQAAVIGIGSGRTTHTLLSNPRLKHVDTIEIEPAMVEGAQQFGPLTSRAFTDARSEIHLEDAKTYFARNGRVYDYIVAEPSNPWVSGVASLFSTEFYAQTRRYLKPDGVFVQWLQLYEINLPLVGTVLRALDSEFEDYEIYLANDNDALIIAKPKGKLPPLSDWVLREPSIAEMMNHIRLRSMDDVQIHRIGSKQTLHALFGGQQLAANSDYFPILDQFAVKQRFLHASAGQLQDLRMASARLDQPAPPATADAKSETTADYLTLNTEFASAARTAQAQRIADVLSGKSADTSTLDSKRLQLLHDLALNEGNCTSDLLAAVWLPAFRNFSLEYLPNLSAPVAQAITDGLKHQPCFAQSPAYVHSWIAFFNAAASGDSAQLTTLANDLPAQTPNPEDPEARAKATTAMQTLIGRELAVDALRHHQAQAAKSVLDALPAAAKRDLSMQYLTALTNERVMVDPQVAQR